ncbi:MAG: phage antirepressor KilAC domain-containing protein [Defluviitaleaceae bacterium]|nr:phage antirepressor KilAC domain-containing protein [Defluviitaleaceae bacterium]
MTDLIPINYDTDTPTVSGRLLHEQLGIGTEYMKWFERMCEYGFSRDLDFSPILTKTPNGGRPSTDHTLTIPMAKEISMLQRNEAGKTIRQYLIKIEEAWNTPEMVMSRALKMADGKIKLLETSNAALTARIEEMRPKEIFADSVNVSTSSILIRDMAKILKQNGLNTEEKRFYETLRNDGFLIKNRGIDYNHPTQKSLDLGLFEMKETVITHASGIVNTYLTPRVTGKGPLYFINKYCPKVPEVIKSA